MTINRLFFFDAAGRSAGGARIADRAQAEATARDRANHLRGRAWIVAPGRPLLELVWNPITRAVDTVQKQKGA